MLNRRQALAAGAATLIFSPAILRAQGAIKWKYAHGGPIQHPSHLASVQMCKLVAERTNGRFQIDVFPDRLLGEEKDLLEGLQLGSIEGSYLSTGPTGNIVPEFNVIDIPFLFKNAQHAYRVFDGPIGRGLMDRFTPKGIYAAQIWENGWRHLTSKKPLSKVDDLKGLKLRTMANQVHIEAFRVLGAGAVPMAWGEVYTSLEQGVIDAQENPVTAIAANSLWEVQKYLTLSAHVYGPHVVMFAQRALNNLPADMRQILLDAARECTPLNRQLSAELEAKALELCKSKGMIVQEIDREELRRRLASLTPGYERRFGKDILDRIQAEAANV